MFSKKDTLLLADTHSLAFPNCANCPINIRATHQENNIKPGSKNCLNILLLRIKLQLISNQQPKP